MIKIDIIRLIDAVVAENEAYEDYCYRARNLYRGNYDGFAERKQRLKDAYDYYNREQNAVWVTTEVLDFDHKQIQRLYIAARAVTRWRIQTNWELLVTDTMREQLEKFIFG